MSNRKSKIENPKSPTGTREWSDSSANCCLGCSHGCLYCYARANALRWKRISSPDEWSRERHLPLPKIVRKKPGVVMFPTTHDVTPGNLEHCLCLLKRLLTAGNRVLIVSKPHLDCVQRLCYALGPWRPLIEFRFSIGAWRNQVLRFWEPNAPCLGERLDSLSHAVAQAFRVSVSCEPVLEPECANAVFIQASDRHAEMIWIGKANKLRERTAWLQGRMAGDELAELEAEIARIEAGQTDQKVREIYEALKGNPKVRWKDSYREVIDRLGLD